MANTQTHQSMLLPKLATLITGLSLCGTSLLAQTYNTQLTKQLDTILYNDQLYRKIKNATPEADRENMNKQSRLDAANLIKAEKMIARYGYPGKALVGPQHQSTIFLVIQHNDTEVQEKYLPLLTLAVQKGDLRPASLAIITDRVKTGHNELQIYGSQTHETPDGVKLYPIADEANVNKRRAKVGLEPLQQYLTKWKINYKLPVAGQPNPNPASLYYAIPHDAGYSPVEAVGGFQAILTKLQYPEQARAAGVTGKVTVELTIDTDGRTKNVSVVKPLGYGCDEEALRVMKEARYTNTSGEERDIRVSLPFPVKQ
ncbi:TonB family protein [Mucilaginibacter sp. CSA2-8R]|uniref:TonB family protein n=1 Tax=Mucilaginibacter sp. CSA2-8R TaxID=3141542 RepID=UPI00315C6939